MRVRVLIICLGGVVTGGISTLVETLVPALKQQVDLLYLLTLKQRPLEESDKILPQNMALGIYQYARFLHVLSSIRSAYHSPSYVSRYYVVQRHIFRFEYLLDRL